MTKLIVITLALIAYIGLWYLLAEKLAVQERQAKEQEEKKIDIVQNEFVVKPKNIQDERIIKSKSYSNDEIQSSFIYFAILCSIITILCGLLVGFVDREMFRKEINDRYFNDVEYFFDLNSEFYAEEKAEILSQYTDWKIAMLVTFLIGFSITFIVSLIVWKHINKMRKSKLKITDEHIIATGDKERTMILPYENVFSISEGGIKGIILYTSIGKVTFSLIKNRDEIIKAISKRIKLDKVGNIPQ